VQRLSRLVQRLVGVDANLIGQTATVAHALDQVSQPAIHRDAVWVVPIVGIRRITAIPYSSDIAERPRKIVLRAISATPRLSPATHCKLLILQGGFSGIQTRTLKETRSHECERCTHEFNLFPNASQKNG
jgi:hypothetical protein